MNSTVAGVGTRTRFGGRRNPQRGVVLLYSLIALGIMLIVAVALIRSFNNSLLTAGNIGFKRDMQNQSERAVDYVMSQFRTGVLNTSTARASDVPSQSYYATMLATNSQGIPNILQAAAPSGAFDVTPASDPSTIANPVRIRYVVDRLCATNGNESSLGAGVCRLAGTPVPSGTSLTNLQGADRAPLCSTCSSAVSQGVIYRLTVMTTGPRNTQSFFQSTFTAPPN